MWYGCSRPAGTTGRRAPTCCAQSAKPASYRSQMLSLRANDLRPLDKALVVDEKSSALPTSAVLGFVKALRGHATECAQRFGAVRTEKTMSVVLDDGDAGRIRHAKDDVHLARYTGVVNRHGGPRLIRDQLFKLPLVEVERVRSHIDEDRL